MSKRSELIGMIISQLVEELSGEQLETVKRILEETVSDYEIEPRNTEIVPADEFIPKYYAIYLARKRLAGRSVETLKLYNYYLMDFFLNKPAPMDQMDSTLMIHYLYDYQKRHNIGNNTLDKVRIIISGFLDWAANEGYIQRNFCANVDPIKYTEKPRQALSDEEVCILKDACISFREKALVDLFLSTGMRLGEVAKLQWSDIDMSRKSILVLGKGSKYRTVFFDSATKISLLKYKMVRSGDSPYVFTSDKVPYQGLHKAAIAGIIKKLKNRAKMNAIVTPHVLRHTYATRLLQKGMPIEQIQTLLGHAEIKTTLIYSHVDMGNVKHEYTRCFA